MAKLTQGILDGFVGSVGTVVGYSWRGRWCMRARPKKIKNPRTEAQQEHRMIFRDMVRLASYMLPAISKGLREASKVKQVTEGNLFVNRNKKCFTTAGVDYKRLVISSGHAAPVEFVESSVDDRMVLHTRFEKNPLRLCADNEDNVFVFSYCPEFKKGLLSSPVSRRSKRLDMALPDEWADCEVFFYAFVQDKTGQTSKTLYIGTLEELSVKTGTGHDVVLVDEFEGKEGGIFVKEEAEEDLVAFPEGEGRVSGTFGDG